MVANWLKFSTALQCFHRWEFDRSNARHFRISIPFISTWYWLCHWISFIPFFTSRSSEEKENLFILCNRCFVRNQQPRPAKWMNEWMNSPSSFCLNRLFYLPFVFCFIVYDGTWLGLTHFYLFDFQFIFVYIFSLRYNRTCSLFEVWLLLSLLLFAVRTE